MRLCNVLLSVVCCLLARGGLRVWARLDQVQTARRGAAGPEVGGGGQREAGSALKNGDEPPKKENRFGRGSLGVSGSTGERGQATDVGGGTSTQERNQKERKRREACGHTRRSVATRTGAKC